MKYSKVCLLGVVALLLSGVVVAENETNVTEPAHYNITRFAPFFETFVCSAVNDSYTIEAVVNTTNISIGNQTYVAIIVNQTVVEIGVNYTVEFDSSTSPNGTQVNSLFIEDFEGRTITQRDWSFVPGETQLVRFHLPFTCPADLDIGIDFQACSRFFDEYISKDAPLLFTLASGTRKCSEELTNRTADFVACQNQIGELEEERVVCREDLDGKEGDVRECLANLNEPEGICHKRILDEKNATATCYSQCQGKVEGYWMILGILGLLSWGFLILKQMMWSG